MKAISYFIYFLQIAMLAAAISRWTEEDRSLESQQIALWKAKISASSAWTDEEKLKEFTLGLKSMFYRSEMDGHDPEIDIIYKQMQEVVTSTPGHADYFTAKIEEAYKSDAERLRTAQAHPEWPALMEKIENTDEGKQVMFNLDSHLWGDYRDMSSECLRVLGHIPSTKSVWALGHYLKERDEPEIKKYKSPGTGFTAAKSLTEMISDGPIQIWQASWEDVAEWQKWFDEVKAGKRTFRFVGSNVEYTLDGPADAKTLERIRNKDSGGQHSGGRRKHAMASDEKTGSNKMGKLFQVGLIASILLCLVALSFLLKRRNVA